MLSFDTPQWPPLEGFSRLISHCHFVSCADATQFPPRASPHSILGEAIYYDEQVEDEWASEERLLEPVQTATSRLDSTKRDTTYSLNFSGGEWAKIAFARTLMKKDADLR